MVCTRVFVDGVLATVVNIAAASIVTTAKELSTINLILCIYSSILFVYR